MQNVTPRPTSPTDANSGLPVLPFLGTRRLFLQWAGLASAGGLMLTSCRNEVVGPDALSSARTGIGADFDVNLGAGDVGILNYAYVLEQLEATFYERVVSNPYAGISNMELAILTDIRDHEIAHREFLKAALGSAAVPMLAIDFPGVNFRSRQSILETARLYEDLGISAYNGAGKYLRSSLNVSTAGKIVSVEARHAAVIRELLQPGTAAFAGDDVVDPVTGLDGARDPGQVAPAVQPFIVQGIIADMLPTPFNV